MVRYNLIKSKLNGPIFSIITGFDSKGQLDIKNTIRYIDYLYSRGATNFYLMVYNSRLGLLNESEVLKLHKECITNIKKLNKSNIVIAAEPYHTSTKQSIEYISKFKKMGADLVSVIFGEKFYSEIQVLKHFKEINKKSNLPLLLHQQILENGLGATPPNVFYPLTLLNKISKLEKFIAMKEDAKNETYTRNICINNSKNLIIITSGSGKRQWLEANKYGCQSWLSGISNLDPLIALDFFNAKKNNNHKFIKLLLQKLEDPFFEVKKKFGWHLTIKSSLEHLGLMSRFERMPLLALSKRDHNAVGQMIKQLRKNNQKYFEGRYFN